MSLLSLLLILVQNGLQFIELKAFNSKKGFSVKLVPWLFPLVYFAQASVSETESHDYHIEAGTNGRHFPDDISKWIFLNENVWILTKISLKFVPGSN